MYPYRQLSVPSYLSTHTRNAGTQSGGPQRSRSPSPYAGLRKNSIDRKRIGEELRQAAIDQEVFDVVSSVRRDVHRHAQLQRVRSRSLPDLQATSAHPAAPATAVYFFDHTVAPQYHHSASYPVTSAIGPLPPFAQFHNAPLITPVDAQSNPSPFMAQHVQPVYPSWSLLAEEMLLHGTSEVLPVLQVNDSELSCEGLEELLATLDVSIPPFTQSETTTVTDQNTQEEDNVQYTNL